ncbi:hypothetical protein GALMADRAFT_267814 [Galerina marginata CBS 339.88]|uniref:MYND-type domain-containing protein n=1 Tax=Galerina marginata (strain CBS 339.88) TaxID=685588 RepID=A0A067TB01_GALM3|nr:hypothetical protein GALMADRAFT_267814 [Galerina marginata CBS 339.88]
MPFQIRQQVIHQDGATPPDNVPNSITDLPVVTCSASGCSNHQNLSKCARCRSAYYCSVDCQKKAWKSHKDACNMNAALLSGDANTAEPPLQRHLRHWTARFEISLLCAAIVGMKVRESFSNIDKYGMIVRLTPRPHANTGGRFSLESCKIMSMIEFKLMLITMGMGMVLDQHNKERGLLRARSKGEEDFAACIVIATNEGRWKLDGEHVTEARFKPLGMSKARARSPQLNDPTLAWLATLTMQIEKDFPMRPIVQ